MAVEFYATWDGNTIRPEMGMDRDEATAIPLHKRVKVKVTQARSLPHHRALYGSLNEIIRQWPETYRPYQPANKDELIAWLKVMAGHKKVTYAKVTTPSEITALKEAYAVERANSNYVWLIERDGEYTIERPDSNNWERLDEIAFSRVFNSIADVLMRETGISLDGVIQYLKSKHEARAA
jgi:hypothetical protein